MRAGVLVAVVLVAAACGGGGGALDAGAEAPETIGVTSPVFSEGGTIPARYTCDGEDVSPPLAWSPVPAEARSVALVVHDPDAPGGDFVHWLLVGRSEGNGSVEEGEAGGVAGTNGFGSAGWRGPCPPEGDDPHTYVFLVLALDTTLDMAPGFGADDLDGAAEGHVLARGALRATYGR